MQCSMHSRLEGFAPNKTGSSGPWALTATVLPGTAYLSRCLVSLWVNSFEQRCSAGRRWLLDEKQMRCVAQILFGPVPALTKSTLLVLRLSRSQFERTVCAGCVVCLLDSNCIQDVGRMLPNMPCVCSVMSCAVCMPARPPSPTRATQQVVSRATSCIHCVCSRALDAHSAQRLSDCMCGCGALVLRTM